MKKTTGTWNFRAVPRDTIIKAKIVAAVQSWSVKSLLIDLVDAEWLRLEKAGALPSSAKTELKLKRE